jgi:ABC-type cobalamin/Fe3+-siderophores transport system ATPase subunit
VTRLRLEAVSVLARERTLLAGADLELGPGDFVALVGPNGAGKTTLLRAALGLVSPASGTVTVGEARLESLSLRERAAALAWLPQAAAPPDALAARDVVMAARYRFRETAAATRHAAEQALERVGLGERAGSPLTELSGGERQRIAIAALLAQEARFLLLDEPANHLDPAQQRETYALLGSLRASGVGILCVTHDVNLLNHVGPEPRVVGLRRAAVRFELPHTAPELPARLSELFGLTMLALPVGTARLIVPAPPGAVSAPPAANGAER